MELLNNVLIKECTGIDLVFIVDNLPKELLYRKTKKLVFVPRYAVDYDRTDPKQVEAYTLRDENMPDEPRNRRVTHELTDELLPGVELSQSGDGAYVFFMNFNEAIDRLAAIDAYIRAQMGPLATIPKRVNYSSQPGSFTAGPKPLSQIPKVVLPVAEPVSPPAVKAVPVAAPAPAQPLILETQPLKLALTDEQRAAIGARLKAARLAKKAKQPA